MAGPCRHLGPIWFESANAVVPTQHWCHGVVGAQPLAAPGGRPQIGCEGWAAGPQAPKGGRMPSAIWSGLVALIAAVSPTVASVIATPLPAPAHGYVWPMQPAPMVARGFEPPPQPWAAGHRGADLAGHNGDPISAAGPGTVTFSGVIAGRGSVAVTHANGWRTTYEPLDQRVAVGTVVVPGAPLGVLASAGSHCAPATCLHWGLITGPQEYRDPLLLLGARRPVLLPLG